LKSIKIQNQHRVLKFTKQGVLNCNKDGFTVLKAFSYDEVSKILLLDLNNFMIYFGKDQIFYFQSTVRKRN
jgi:hypothetical protein